MSRWSYSMGSVHFELGSDRLVARAVTLRSRGEERFAAAISMPELVKLLKKQPDMRRELLALLMLEEVKCERKAQSA